MQLYLGLFLLWSQHARYTPPQPRTPLPSGSDCQVLASGQAPGWVRKLNRAHPMWWDKGSSNLSAECCAGIRGRPRTPQTQEAGQASWKKERK